MAKTINFEELRRGLAIDEDNLDECLMQQAELFDHVGQALVAATALHDQSELDLELLTAELDEQFRSKPSYSKEKVTETSIKQEIRRSPKFQKLQEQLLNQKEERDKLAALSRSYDQRSKMLVKLVDWKVAHLRQLGDAGSTRNARYGMMEVAREEVSWARRRRAAEDD